MEPLLIHLTCIICVTVVLLTQAHMVSAEDIAAQPEAGTPASEIIPLPKKTITQEDEPPALRGKYYLLERPELGLKFSFESDQEKVIDRGEKREDTVTEFREGFILASRGWLYHPALLLFDIEIEPQWSQISQDLEGDSSLFIPTYFLNATLLPDKPYSLYVFGRRYEDTLISTFSIRSDLEIDSYGADLSLKSKALPTIFKYQHLDRQQESFFISRDEQDNFRLIMNQQQGNSDTRLDAQYIDSIQTSDSTFNNLTNSFNRLLNTYKFGGDPTRKLTSDLSYNRTEDNTFTSTDLRLLERLYLKHRKNLWTNYTLLYDQLESDRFEDTTVSASGELTHLLYENLTTSVFGGAANSDFNDGSENNFEGALNFDYNRRIPWGMLSTSAGFRSLYTQRNGATTNSLASNEPHILATGVVIFLDNEDIDIDSIRVTDSTRTTVYVRNQDYVIEQVDSFIRIQRTFFGSITNNENVLVSYQFLTDPDFDDNVYSQSYGITLHLFSTLRLSYNYFQAKQHIISGREPDNPIEDKNHLAIAQLLWRWTDTRFSYDYFTTSSSPSRTTWRAEETLSFSPLSRLSMQFSGYYGQTSFTDNIGKEKFYGLNSNLHWLASSWCRLGLEGNSDWISADRIDTLSSGLASFIELEYGKWRCNFNYRFLDYDDEFREYQRKRNNFFFKIVRTF